MYTQPFSVFYQTEPPLFTILDPPLPLSRELMGSLPTTTTTSGEKCHTMSRFLVLLTTDNSSLINQKRLCRSYRRRYSVTKTKTKYRPNTISCVRRSALVHTCDKVEFNTVDLVESQLSCCRNRQQIGNNVNSTSCLGQLCCQCVPGFTSGSCNYCRRLH